MQAIKNALVILVLVGVAYGAYVVLYRTYGTPPPEVDTSFTELNVQGGVETSPGIVSPGIAMPGPPSSVPAVGQAPATKENAPPQSAPSIPPLTISPNQAPTQQPPSVPNISAPPTTEIQAPPGGQTKYPETTANPFASRPIDGAPNTGAPNTSSPPAATQAAPVDPADTAEIEHKWQTAQQLLSAGKLVEAHELLSDLYGRPALTPERDAELTKLLGQLAGTIIFDASTRYGLAPPYVVQPQDTLERIAAEHKVSPVFLAKVNGLASPSDLRPGETIKVVRGPFRAIVDLRERREEVTLVLDGRYAGRFPLVRPLGSDFTMPARDDQVFNVVEKDPADLWIGLGGKLGLHAASEGGRRGAHDSIPLAARDAQDLFDILTADSQVAIRR